MILQKVDRIMRQICRSWESKIAIATDRSQYYWSLVLYLIMNRNVFNLTSGVCPPAEIPTKCCLSIDLIVSSWFFIDRVYFVKLLIWTMFYHFITSDNKCNYSQDSHAVTLILVRSKKIVQIKGIIRCYPFVKKWELKISLLKRKWEEMQAQLDLSSIFKREHTLTLYWFDSHWSKHA